MSASAYRWLAPLLMSAALLAGAACGSGSKHLILATTTSTRDTGLLDVLVSAFEKESGYHVQVIAVGTGQTLEMGRRGDADVLLVHAPTSEEQFVADGYGVNRQLVMHNDFIVVGPADDPAGIRGAPDVLVALRAIAGARAAFMSRGDDSGTHKLELALWEDVEIDPSGQSWYDETGQGMGETLTIANQRKAYTISDRGTYLAFRDQLDLRVLLEGDPRLLNIYHVMQVNPDRFPKVKAEGAGAFVAFMVSPAAQAIIKDFGVDTYGQALFVPDAGKTEAELTGE